MSELVFNCIYASVLRHEGLYYGEKGTVEMVSQAGESWTFGIEKGEISRFLAKYGFGLSDHLDSIELENAYFKDPTGKIIGRVNGTQCLVRAVKTRGD